LALLSLRYRVERKIIGRETASVATTISFFSRR
jgi:hypothetical protein